MPLDVGKVGIMQSGPLLICLSYVSWGLVVSWWEVGCSPRLQQGCKVTWNRQDVHKGLELRSKVFFITRGVFLGLLISIILHTFVSVGYVRRVLFIRYPRSFVLLPFERLVVI